MRTRMFAASLVLLAASCQDEPGSLSGNADVLIQPIARSVRLSLYGKAHHAGQREHFWSSLLGFGFTREECSDAACVGYDKHGGRADASWSIAVEKPGGEPCAKAYPIISDERSSNITKKEGVNTHDHPIYDPHTCGYFQQTDTIGGGVSNIMAKDCKTEVEAKVAHDNKPETSRAYLVAGIGYAAKHAGSSGVLAPSVTATSSGAEAGLSLSFRYENESWGNSFSVKCEYMTTYDATAKQVVLNEKCWRLGLSGSGETSNMEYGTDQPGKFGETGAYAEIGRVACDDTKPVVHVDVDVKGELCGDAICGPEENCQTCSGDCGACPDICGDGTCAGTEDCVTCAGDCGPCGGPTTCQVPEGSLCQTGSTNPLSCCTPGLICGGTDDFGQGVCIPMQPPPPPPPPSGCLNVPPMTCAVGSTLPLECCATGSYCVPDVPGAPFGHCSPVSPPIPPGDA